jgi:hypothetical protein
MQSEPSTNTPLDINLLTEIKQASSGCVDRVRQLLRDGANANAIDPTTVCAVHSPPISSLNVLHSNQVFMFHLQGVSALMLSVAVRRQSSQSPFASEKFPLLTALLSCGQRLNLLHQIKASSRLQFVQICFGSLL